MSLFWSPAAWVDAWIKCNRALREGSNGQKFHRSARIPMGHDCHLCEAVNNGVKTFPQRNVGNILDPFWPVFIQSFLEPGGDDFGYFDGTVRRSLVGSRRKSTELLQQLLNIMLDS